MLRAILAVVLGYLTMAAAVFLLLTGAYLGMGADRAFQPGAYQVTPTWLAAWAAVSIIAAVLGGLVCADIARTRTPVRALVIVVLILGTLQAVGVAVAPKPTPEQQIRSGDVGVFDAMVKARSPLWVAIATPIVGAAGVLAGARLVKKPAEQD